MGKCRFHKYCRIYDKESRVCNSDSQARNYYGIDEPCGCYHEMELEEEKRRIDYDKRNDW